MRQYFWAGLLCLAGCGGGDAGGNDAAEAVRESSAGSDEAPPANVLTSVPDSCSFLRRGDAEAILGAPTGEGKRMDAGGWNCVYDTTDKPRRRLVLDMYPGRDHTIESTQLGMTVQACGMKRVESFEGLGRESALWRASDGQCGDNRFLWVATGTVFRGRLRPEMEREVTRHVHFAVSISPAGGADAGAPALREAARYVLERLEG